MEKYMSLNFTISELEKPLKEKRVTVTIRGIGFIERFGYTPGDFIDVKYKGEPVGIAFITGIRNISYTDLLKPEIFKKGGFNSAEELINVLGRVHLRYYWENILDGKTKLPLIEFEWNKDNKK